MKVRVEVTTYTERLPTDIAGAELPSVHVWNHWSSEDKVWIQIGDSKAVVLANELVRAIEAAQKAHR